MFRISRPETSTAGKFLAMEPTAKALDDLITKDAFVRRLAASLVGHSDADDVAQEVYAAGLRAPPAGDRDSAPWIFQVARRIAWRGRRASAHRSEREIAAAKAEATDSTATIVEREQIRRRVVESVLDLPVLYREPVILRWFDDLSIKEIAARLSITEDAVKSRLKRALGMLRTTLDESSGGSRTQWIAALLPPAGAKTTATRVAQLGWIGFLMTTTKALWGVIFGFLAAAIAVIVWAQSGANVIDDADATGADRASEIATNERRADAESSAAPETKKNATPAPFAPTQNRAASTVAGKTEDDRPGQLEIRCLFSDGSAAADIDVAVKSGRNFDFAPPDHALRTDADGYARFSIIAPGPWMVATSRGGPTEHVTVRPATVATCDVRIPSGATITGIVNDADGKPVPDADVRSSMPLIEFGDRWIGRTDGKGRFKIRDVPIHASVFATAKDCAPSLAVSLGSVKADNGVLNLELTLQPGGGAIVGSVRTSTGETVADATIVVGEDGPDLTRQRRTASGFGSVPKCRGAISDAAGDFAITGWAAGKWPVVVRRRGLGMWRGMADVAAGGEVRLSPILGRSASIVGRVLYEDTRPVSGARVGNRSTNTAEEIVTRTNAFGDFRLADVGKDEITIEIVGDDLMKVRETFRLAEGEERVWNPVLRAGRTIKGRIVDENGQPQRSAMVAVVADDDQGTAAKPETLQSDASAKFRIASLEDRTYTITAFHKGTVGGQKSSASLNGIRPGSPEITIVLPNLEPTVPGAIVIGTVVDEEGEPIAKANLYQVRKVAIRGSDHQLAMPNGSFRFENVAPGEVEFRIVAPGYCTHRTKPATAVVGETLDLGKIVLESGGQCAVKISREGGGPVGEPRILLLGQPEQFALTIDGSVARSGVVRAGNYFLVAKIADTNVPEQTIEIKKGATTEATIVLPPLLRRIVRISPPSSAVEGAVQIIVRRDGADILRINPPRSQDGTYECAFDLDPGTYRIEMKERGNVIGTVPLTIRRDDPDGGPIPLQMAQR